jgi:hypothetical protein
MPKTKSESDHSDSDTEVEVNEEQMLREILQQRKHIDRLEKKKTELELHHNNNISTYTDQTYTFRHGPFTLLAA